MSWQKVADTISYWRKHFDQISMLKSQKMLKKEKKIFMNFAEIFRNSDTISLTDKQFVTPFLATK